MYYEEYLPQDSYDADIQNDDISVSILSEDDSQIIMSKFNTQQKKQADWGYLKQKLLVNGEIKRVETFSSKLNCNAKIRHAISGHRTYYRVGSPEEQLYFSVTDTTTKSNEPRRIYFNNPEEFERHYYVTVPTEIKNDWLLKRKNVKIMEKKRGSLIVK
jgi:hypothetical protein